MIELWARDRNLIEGSDPKSQFVKLMEEAGELAHGLARGHEDEIFDSVGDMIVVLTILSAQMGFEIQDCINGAYAEIKDRRGRMVDGIFVKEEDL
jgi:NTP pyrophosphatase (non-canonical NTP hydrolase)